MSETKDKNGYDIRPNSIMLFENNKKTKDSHPDYTGKIFDADGVEWFVSCWVKEAKNGNSYLSGSLTNADEARAKWGKEDEKKNEKLPETSTVTESGTHADDDLPF